MDSNQGAEFMDYKVILSNLNTLIRTIWSSTSLQPKPMFTPDDFSSPKGEVEITPRGFIRFTADKEVLKDLKPR